MSAPLIASSSPTAVRRHRVRNTAAVAGVAVVIAAGGYAATNTFGVRYWARVGPCGPPNAALLVLADAR